MKIKNIIHHNHPIIDDLSHYTKLVEKINQIHQELISNSDEELKILANDLKIQALNQGLNSIKLPFYALVKEICTRKLGLTPYDVQLIGALAMNEGKLIEMQTGEGKTLAAVMPLALNALLGAGVHLMTFNDYLARRDANWMRPVYEFLGLSVGFIQQQMSKAEKKAAYACDITYSTAKNIGFDYLRTFMEYHSEDVVMRDFNYVIVDEADAILIDEARNPLVLAGDMLTAELDYYTIADFIKTLNNDTDFKFNENALNVYFLDAGIEKAERHFQIQNIADDENYDLYAALNLALHARYLLHKDVDYIIQNGEIKLVDEFTGRIVADRKWRSGLQTAVEAKEKLEIQTEGTILNSITLQHLLQKYPKIAGMTATAQSAAEEFQDFYGLKTVVIPTHHPCIRIDHIDEVFTTKKAKYEAIIQEVKRVHQRQQPILIGTLTVKESEYLANLLVQNSIKCQVLNAKNDELEAKIISNAGKLGAVTISTNMAGRGTDIKLGGADELERNIILKLGGLYVLGTNRHESLRIDRQLRGRAARQGDVGESRFFVSYEDDLMVKYKLDELLPKAFRGLKQDAKIDDKKVRTSFAKTQQTIENCLFDVRKLLCEYSDFVEKQRTIIQKERQEILNNPLEYKDRIIAVYSPAFYQKLKTVILYQYDKHLAMHLEELSRVRENIYAVRLGGQNPLRIFREKSDSIFKRMCQELDVDIQKITERLFANPKLSLEDLEVFPPSSTWTYITNDNPFDNQLSVMLMDNANIGMQVDPFAASLIFVKALMDWGKRRKKSKLK